MSGKIGVYFDQQNIGGGLDLTALAEQTSQKWGSLVPVVKVVPVLALAVSEIKADIEAQYAARPQLAMVDAELVANGEQELTFFEALTVLAFAAFADAPVDVVVLEVGMGGEWDSTNIADAQVAVLTPIALDHTHRLGSTIEEIARTKAGIIKPLAEVVTAEQDPEALAEILRSVELTESQLSLEGTDFGLVSAEVAVGGQLITVRGRAGTYPDLFLPLFGDHQGRNAALAIAAVEAFGTYLDTHAAQAIGLLPSAPQARITALGNAAGEGAAVAVANCDAYREARRLARIIEHVELGANPKFMQVFADSMLLA